MSTPTKTESLSKTKGKIVLVPFPFEDFSTRKVRPVLCLSEPIGKFEHVIVAFVSSKMNDQLEETELEINPMDDQWQETGLVTKSILKLHKMVALPKNLILRELGEFPQAMIAEVEKRIKTIFGIR